MSGEITLIRKLANFNLNIRIIVSIELLTIFKRRIIHNMLLWCLFNIYLVHVIQINQKVIKANISENNKKRRHNPPSPFEIKNQRQKDSF